MPANHASRFFRVLTIFGGLTAGCLLGSLAAAALEKETPAFAPESDSGALLIRAARVFDGKDLRNDAAVVVAGGEIVAVGPPSELRGRAAREMDLGDSTLMPGFIELHAHLAFRKVPRDVVLRHGVTTVRDVGGPLLPPSGGRGELRLLTAGPIITVQNGYPVSVFGRGYIAEMAQSPEAAIVGQLHSIPVENMKHMTGSSSPTWRGHGFVKLLALARCRGRGVHRLLYMTRPPICPHSFFD